MRSRSGERNAIPSTRLYQPGSLGELGRAAPAPRSLNSAGRGAAGPPISAAEWVRSDTPEARRAAAARRAAEAEAMDPHQRLLLETGKGLPGLDAKGEPGECMARPGPGWDHKVEKDPDAL